MDNEQILNITGWKFFDPAIHQRFGKWAMEVFNPIRMKSPYTTGISRYQIIRENPSYCQYMSTYRDASIGSFIKHHQEPDVVNVVNDMTKTWGDKRDVIWNHVYERESAIDNVRSLEKTGSNTEVGTFEAIHLEAFELTLENAAEYYTWFKDIGEEVFITRIMKLAGLIGYDHYRFVPLSYSYFHFDKHAPKEPLGPPYVSVFYFDSVAHCLDFRNSRELAAFRAGLSPYFPDGLKLKWDVDYKLLGSWTKKQ